MYIKWNQAVLILSFLQVTDILLLFWKWGESLSVYPWFQESHSILQGKVFSKKALGEQSQSEVKKNLSVLPKKMKKLYLLRNCLANICWSWRRAEDVFNMSSAQQFYVFQDVLKTSWRRLEDVLEDKIVVYSHIFTFKKYIYI